MGLNLIFWVLNLLDLCFVDLVLAGFEICCSYGLVFISIFNFFYLVKINKLIFFNLEADVESHVDTGCIILIFFIFSVCQLCNFRL